jgi:PAS domain-containing protein
MPRSPKAQVEKRTRHELRQLQELMNHLPVVVYRYRLEDGQRPHLLYISEGVQRLTGQSAAEVMADPMLLFARIHPDDWPGFAAADLQAWQTQSDFALELRFILPSGDACWLYFSSLPFELADGSIAYHGFIEDITQRIAAAANFRHLQRRHFSGRSPGHHHPRQRIHGPHVPAALRANRRQPLCLAGTPR